MLIRSTLDSRDSVMGVIDFYDKVLKVFNDEAFIRETKLLHDLQKAFVELKKFLHHDAC